MFKIHTLNKKSELISLLTDLFKNKCENAQSESSLIDEVVDFVVAQSSNGESEVTKYSAYIADGILGVFSNDGDDLGSLEEWIKDSDQLQIVVFEKQ